MNGAKVTITGELLVELLHLPPGTVISGSLSSGRFGEVEIVVEHPDLPPVDSYRMATATPTFKSNPPVEFVAWNVTPYQETVGTGEQA